MHCAMVGPFVAGRSTARRFGARRLSTEWPSAFSSSLKMSDSASKQGWLWWVASGCVTVSAIILGCSTLDGRDRGYSEQMHPTAAPRDSSGPAIASSKEQFALPLMTKAAHQPAVEKPSNEPASDQDETHQLLESSTSPSSLDSAIGVERSYLLPFSDIGTHGKALATRYASLQPAACRAEVHRRHIAAVPAAGLALGIATPMRLVGPLGNVRIVAPGPKSVHGKMDCRLVLLLDEVSALLSEQGVAVVYVDGFYRPKAHLAGKKSPSQHAFGLAIDIHGFGTKDGRSLLVERDFAGRVGSPVCGEGAFFETESKESIELRNIVCALARARAFHYLLTPNYDTAHSNHLHGDIKRGGKEHVLR